MRTNTHTFPFFLFNLLETILKLLETLLFPSLFKVRLPPRISFNVFTFLYIRHKSLYNNSEILHFFFFLFFYFCSLYVVTSSGLFDYASRLGLSGKNNRLYGHHLYFRFLHGTDQYLKSIVLDLVTHLISRSTSFPRTHRP